MSITKRSVVNSAMALMAFVLLAVGVQAGPTEVRELNRVGILEQELALDGTVIGDTAGCSDDVFKLLPNGNLAMTVSSYYSKDTRDKESYFVCSTREMSKFLAASFQSFDGDYYNSPFRMKITESNSNSGAAKRVVGWYLAVQEDAAGDSAYPGYLRLSADPDSKRASWWVIRTVDGVDYLTVAYAPAAPSIGYDDLWTLSIPPNSGRDRLTNYFAVGPTADGDLSRAVKFERTPV